MKNYQIIIYAGNTPPTFKGSTVIHFSEEDCNYANVIEKIKTSSLSSSDLRAKALVIFDGINEVEAISLYSALIGFSGRRIEYLFDGKLYDGETFLQRYSKITDLGKPSEPIDEVVLGGEGGIIINEQISIDDITKIRYGKNCSIIRSSEIFNDFIKVSALRFRNNTEHLPNICLDGQIYDYEALRKKSNELRREVKNDVRGFVVNKVDINERVDKIEKVSRTPISIILEHLNVFHDVENDYWRCPRPERHTNGDRNPSMKIIEDKIRCYRCDSENIDSLRLVMDIFSLSTDDAAEYILSITRAQSNQA